jgi:hypothetical protein
MVRILEFQQDIHDLHNYQSRIVEFESFEDYCGALLLMEAGLQEGFDVYDKKVYLDKKEVVLKFYNPNNYRYFSHFAKVVD